MQPKDKLRGFARLAPAWLNSWDGFKSAWTEPAFHMEAWLCAFLCPFAFVLGTRWLELAFLLACLLLDSV